LGEEKKKKKRTNRTERKTKRKTQTGVIGGIHTVWLPVAREVGRLVIWFSSGQLVSIQLLVVLLSVAAVFTFQRRNVKAP